MIIQKTMSEGWLSNTWLVGDRPGGHCVIIDTGAPMEPILRCIQEHRLTPTHVLCTHHHPDHVLYNTAYKERFGCPVCGHADERSLFGDLDEDLIGGDEIHSGELTIRALHIPGHTLGQLAFLVNEEAVFTGDTLFRRSIGGTRGRGHTTFADLKHSILEVLMRLDPEMPVYPGHMDPTTIGEEWQENPFLQLWRGEIAPSGESCLALGEPAELLLRARDYDGGFKCQVRFEASGEVDLVPGSRVELR